MRILVLSHEYPPIGGGGGRVALDICEGMAKVGHEMTILTPHYKDLPREEILEGVRVIRLPSLRNEPFRASFASMAGYVAAGLRAGLALIPKWRPDVIHVHFAVPAGPIAWTLSRLTGIPYLLTAHLGDVPGGVPEKTGGWFRWVYPITPRIWKDAARVVAVSEFTRQLAGKHYPGVEVQVIHNGVDLGCLQNLDLPVGQPPRIVFAGRFAEQKNPVQLVRSLAEVRDLPWTCVMVGDGALRPSVEEEIRKYGMQDRFEMTGWITPNDVLAWFGRSDILFMPSLSEGLPVVGVQSLAMGLAIVTSRVGGFVDIVDQGKNGFLVDSQDSDQYAVHLRQLLSDHEMLHAFRLASRQRAKNFDILTIVKDYEAVFQDILDQRMVRSWRPNR